MRILLLVATLAVGPGQRGPATTVPDARDAAIAWFSADLDHAPQYLVASAQRQIAAVRTQLNANAETRDAFAMAFALAGVARSHGQPVTVSGSRVAIGQYLDVTFGKETINGDRATVPLTLSAGGTPGRGSVELTREADGWRVAAVDLGAEMPHWPRFDSPRFIVELADMIEASSRQAVAAGRGAAALGAVRMVQSAETAWKETHGGFYAPLRCLTAPAACDPASTESAYLDREPAAAGFTPAFVAGYSATAAELARAHAPRGSLKGWAFGLLPQAKDASGYCGDSTGLLCTLAPGATVSGPACPASCTPIK